MCRTQCATEITLCLTSFFVWFGWTLSYWVYDEIFTEHDTLSLPPQSVRLFELSLWHFATCVWLRHRAQIDRVRETLLHCCRLRHSATVTNCFFCTTDRCFLLSFRRVWCACVQPVTDIVPLCTNSRLWTCCSEDLALELVSKIVVQRFNLKALEEEERERTTP